MSINMRSNSRSWLVVAIIMGLAAMAIAAVSSVSPLTDEANALRLAELENELSAPTSLVELSQTQLQQMDHATIIEQHVQSEDQDEAAAIQHAWTEMSEEQQRADVDASLAEVEAAEREERPVNAEVSSLLQTSDAAQSSTQYWNNAWNRRWWCSAVRWGYWWIERHPHWQNICRGIERFRPWGWWSHMCHNIYSGHWGWWYRHNWWWRHHCQSIRNPHYVGSSTPWRWHPGHRRHHYSEWCEQHGHNYRDLNNGHYNHWCFGREAPANYQRGLWDVDPKASRDEQNNYWFCRDYRSYDDGWKKNTSFQQFRSKCATGEGARGAKYPGFDPNLTPEQRAEIERKAREAEERARAKASEPKWVWAKSVPRTSDSQWCEENGLTQHDTARYAKSCEGNRETEEDRQKRIARAARRARQRVLRRIPRRRGGKRRRVKQIKKRRFIRNPKVIKARRKAKIARMLATLTPEQKAALDAKMAAARQQAAAALPTGVKNSNVASLINALKVAALAPVPKRNATKIVMPAPPTLPPKPATAPTTTELKKVAVSVQAVTLQTAAPAKPVVKAPEPAPQPPAPQPDPQPAFAAAAKQAEPVAPPPPPPPPPAEPIETEPVEAAAKVAAPAAAAAPVAMNPIEALEARWAKEDAIRRRERRERLAREDEEDRRADDRRERRRKRDEYLRSLAKTPEGRRGTPGEDKDWDAKIPSLGKYVPKKKAWVSPYATGPGNGCPTCKLPKMRKKWPIVLDPTSVAAIDIPLIEELHRRVDYLVDPVKKKLKVSQRILDSAAKQVVDAEEHHIRVYDFGEKHRKQLLIPKRIQDEQKIVQLE
jgi:hypothetical protein